VVSGERQKEEMGEVGFFRNEKSNQGFETHIQTGEIRRVVVQCGVVVVDESVGNVVGRHVRQVQGTLKKVNLDVI